MDYNLLMYFSVCLLAISLPILIIRAVLVYPITNLLKKQIVIQQSIENELTKLNQTLSASEITR